MELREMDHDEIFESLYGKKENFRPYVRMYFEEIISELSNLEEKDIIKILRYEKYSRLAKFYGDWLDKRIDDLKLIS